MKAISVYLIFLIAAIIGGVYMIIYRQRINNALKENNGRHTGMPDARSVIIVILAVILFYGVFKTKYLIGQIEDNVDANIYWAKHDIINELENQISRLEYEIEELKNANNLVKTYDFIIEDYDIEKGVATYKLEVILKSISADTKVSVSIDDMSIELINNSQGKFIGNIEVDLFEYFQADMNVFITQGDITTVESFSLVSLGEAWKQYLPTIAAKVPFEWEYSKNRIKLNEKLEMYFEDGTAGKFVDAYLEISLAGDDTEKVDIDFIDGKTAYSVSLEDYLPEVYPLSKLDVYVVGVDSLGYTHKALVSSWREEVWITYDVYKEMEMKEMIYDKDGNLLTSRAFNEDNN